jgi:decaprenyl-phosphate phosphoribosyltransferase
MATVSVKSGAVNEVAATPSLWGHLQILRVDHWFKNVFVLPGIVVALGLDPLRLISGLRGRIVLGLISTCLVSSSNYVLNEIIDAPFDRHHPTKSRRPVPAGRVHVRLAYLQWAALAIVGIGLGLTVSTSFALTMLALWLMGCLYNVPPVRSKDLPYVDVLSEAVNNPLRMLAGWFIVSPAAVVPASLLIAYWMAGSYFMALKRFAEYRKIADPIRAAAYRKSLAFYDEPRLLVSVMFYASAAMLFFGAFLMRYRIELVASFPLVATVMAIYLALAFKDDSPVQRPEGLFREPVFLAAVITCALVMVILLFKDLPLLSEFFAPTLPTNPVSQEFHPKATRP